MKRIMNFVELAERLYLSLLEGANAGGDRRGLFSANTILVVNENKPPKIL